MNDGSQHPAGPPDPILGHSPQPVGTTVQVARAVEQPGAKSSLSRQPSTRQIAAIVLGLVLFLAVLIGLAGYAAVQMIRVVEKQQQPRTLTSLNPRASITLPGGWSEVTDLAPEALFQARSLDEQTYLLVTQTPKEDLADDLDLEDFADLALQWTKEGLLDPEVSEPSYMDINGRSMIRVKIEGEIELQKTVILQAVAEDSLRFYTIQLGTVPSKYLAVSGSMEQVSESFTVGETSPLPRP